VVLDAHAHAVEHDRDEYRPLDVTAFDEALDASPQPRQTPICTSSSSSSHHLSSGAHCHHQPPK